MKVKDVKKENAMFKNEIKILLADEGLNEVLVSYSSYDIISFFKSQELWQKIYDNLEEEVFFNIAEQFFIELGYDVLKNMAEQKFYGRLQ